MITPDSSVQELLEATGQVKPPVQLKPLIEALGCKFKWAEVTWPRVEKHAPDTIVIPRGRSDDPLIRFAIAHDLRHAALRQPGDFSDLAIPHLIDRELAFDRWARALLLPLAWFREDALRRLRVLVLAKRYGVRPEEVIWRALELEFCHLVCRDRESYQLYLRHPYWASKKEPLGRRFVYLTTNPYCEALVCGRPCGRRATTVHHLDPSGYQRLGRERDEDLRAFCPLHHDVQHRGRDGQLQLQLGDCG